MRWNVVEQSAFVDCGIAHFQNDNLRFFRDLSSCLAAESVNVAVLSGVLPYVEDPHAMLQEVARARPVLRRLGMRDVAVVRAGDGKVDRAATVVRMVAGR